MSTEDRVKEMIAKKFNVEIDQLKRSHSFSDDLAADSIDVEELIMDMEDEFEVDVPEEYKKKNPIIGDVIDFFSENRGRGLELVLEPFEE